MGWGRFLLLGNLGQQLDLSDHMAELERQREELDQLRGELRQGRPETPDLSLEVWQLRNENDELKLYVAALVRILVSRNVMTAEEFKRFVEVIDAEDGSADGAFHGKVC